MSKSDGKTVAPRKPAARKSANRATTKAASPVAEANAPAAPSPKNMLTAGIKALTSAHEEAFARQSRVFESLLGLGQKRDDGTADEKSAAPRAATTIDPFGFKKFEDVFDQRVERALQHLGVPTAQAFADLSAEVERLRETVARLEAAGPKR